MLKSSDNPPMTFPPDTNVTEMEGTWWVAHTKPRQEKALARDLSKRQMGYFLPMVEKVTVIRGRKFRPIMPLFPSYVFVCGTPERRNECFRGRRLAGAVNVADQGRLVGELHQIQSALGAHIRLDPWPYLKRGRRCRVSSGPFEGMEGIIDRRKDRARLVLRVETLGQAVALEIDAGLLEPVD